MTGRGRPFPLDYLPRREDVRRLAAIAFVLLCALVAATIARPHGAYRDAGRLVLMLAAGATAGALVLLGLAATAVRLGRHRHEARRSILERATSYDVLGLGVAVLTIAVLAIELWPSGPASTQDPAMRTAFFGWQRDTVPLTLGYMDALRTLAPAVEGSKPLTPIQAKRVRRAAHTLAGVARALAGQAAAHGRYAELRALTQRFARAVGLARQAASAMAPGRRPTLGTRAVLVRAQQNMQVFTLQANALGARLTAEQL